MKKLLAIIAALIVTLLPSCGGNVPPPPEGQWQRSFITSYLMPTKPGEHTNELSNINSFIRPWHEIGVPLEEIDSACVLMVCSGRYIRYGENNGPYQNLARRYGDLSYNDWVEFNSLFSPSHTALGEPVVGITVRCINAFDDSHPALASLNDVVQLEWYSFYDYIRQGYRIDDSTRGNGWSGGNRLTDNSDWDGILYHADLTDSTIFPIDLMGKSFSIRFKKAPKESGEYTFRIEMELESGRQTSEFQLKWQ